MDNSQMEYNRQTDPSPDPFSTVFNVIAVPYEP
jgi:hypothetical protein